MIGNHYLLAVFAVMSLSAYCGYAWNHTTLPVYLFKLLAKLKLLKEENRKSLESVYTRDDWQLWSTVVFPDFITSWLNCHICQAPYVAGLFSWLILYKSGGFSFSYSFLGWCLSLIAVIKLQETNGPHAAVPASKSTNLEKVKSTIKKYKMPEDLTKHQGPLDKVAEYTVDKIVPKPQNKTELNPSVLNVFSNSVLSLQQAQNLANSLVEKTLNEAKDKSTQQLEQVADQYKLWQKEMGIETKDGPNGENIIVGYNPVLLETMKFFKKEEPCFFPGCEELREQHARELESKGAECPSCVKGELQRKYMVLVKRALETIKNQPPSNA